MIFSLIFLILVIINAVVDYINRRKIKKVIREHILKCNKTLAEIRGLHTHLGTVNDEMIRLNETINKNLNK